MWIMEESYDGLFPSLRSRDTYFVGGLSMTTPSQQTCAPEDLKTTTDPVPVTLFVPSKGQPTVFSVWHLHKGKPLKQVLDTILSELLHPLPHRFTRSSLPKLRPNYDFHSTVSQPLPTHELLIYGRRRK